MYNLEYIISLYMYMLMCFILCFYYKHLLLVIISLELMTVNLIYNMYIIMFNLEMNLYIMMFMMVLMVCEGALSLSLIILLVRFYGNDYVNSLSMLKW